MKILITTDVFPPRGGGSAHSTAALGRALAERGHDVSVLVWRRNVVGELRRDWEGVSIFEYGVGKGRAGGSQCEMRAARYMKEWAQDKKFDLAHAQHWLSAKATVEASRSGGFPVVITVRDYWPVCIWSTRLSGRRHCPGCSYARRVLCVGRRRPWLWPLAPFLPPMVGREIDRRMAALEKASAVIAVSDYVKRTLPVRHSVVIPNLLDLSEIERRMIGPPSPELPERFALFVGKLEPNKAPDRLFPILRAAGVRLPLVIAGEGSLEASLRKEAARVEEEVRFAGWVDPDVALRLMHRAAALVFPSRWDEPLSRVLLEGLAAGAALVVEPTGGSEEIVVHGESGLLGRSVEELGAALRRLATEAGLATKLRQGARRRARERFSKDVVIPEIEELYGRVVKGEKIGE
jgi:glycosyltransferase involved in cell wall biosynthesis